MKSVFIAGMLLVAAQAGFAQQPETRASNDKPNAAPQTPGKVDDDALAAQTAVLAAERAFRDAQVKHDSDALQHLLRADFIALDMVGHVWNSHEMIMAYDAAGKTPGPKPALNSLRIRYYGNATVAVLTGAESYSVPKPYAARFCHVWVKTNDVWQMAQSQTTKITETAPKPPKGVIIRPPSK